MGMMIFGVKQAVYYLKLGGISARIAEYLDKSGILKYKSHMDRQGDHIRLQRFGNAWKNM